MKLLFAARNSWQVSTFLLLATAGHLKLLQLFIYSSVLLRAVSLHLMMFASLMLAFLLNQADRDGGECE